MACVWPKLHIVVLWDDLISYLNILQLHGRRLNTWKLFGTFYWLECSPHTLSRKVTILDHPEVAGSTTRPSGVVHVFNKPFMRQVLLLQVNLRPDGFTRCPGCIKIIQIQPWHLTPPLPIKKKQRAMGQASTWYTISGRSAAWWCGKPSTVAGAWAIWSWRWMGSRWGPGADAKVESGGAFSRQKRD